MCMHRAVRGTVQCVSSAVSVCTVALSALWLCQHGLSVVVTVCVDACTATAVHAGISCSQLYSHHACCRGDVNRA
jgi:hypothetical protein